MFPLFLCKRDKWEEAAMGASSQNQSGNLLAFDPMNGPGLATGACRPRPGQQALGRRAFPGPAHSDAVAVSRGAAASVIPGNARVPRATGRCGVRNLMMDA